MKWISGRGEKIEMAVTESEGRKLKNIIFHEMERERVNLYGNNLKDINMKIVKKI